MTESLSSTPVPYAGDIARRRARIALLSGLVATPLSIWLMLDLAPVWARIMALDGFPFMLGATALGAALAVGPLVGAGGLLLALWWGVDSVYKPRRRASPGTDRAIIAIALFIWSLPTLGMLGLAAQALFTGRVHFTRPPRDYFLASDPIAFWQGVGFWLIMSGFAAFLAWRYWQPRLARGRQ